jgi:hypothetical protein
MTALARARNPDAGARLLWEDGAQGMDQTYELQSGRRTVAVKIAPSAQAALFDHLRSLGCRDDEITRLGVDSIAWRGAVFRAVPTGSPAPARRD